MVGARCYSKLLEVEEASGQRVVVYEGRQRGVGWGSAWGLRRQKAFMEKWERESAVRLDPPGMWALSTW